VTKPHISVTSALGILRVATLKYRSGFQGEFATLSSVLMDRDRADEAHICAMKAIHMYRPLSHIFCLYQRKASQRSRVGRGEQYCDGYRVYPFTHLSILALQALYTSTPKESFNSIYSKDPNIQRSTTICDILACQRLNTTRQQGD
jgi:hypothetical protein